MSTADSVAPKTSLFVSYSRKDARFVAALIEALGARGYDVRIDRSDIRKGEEWWKRIVDLIVDSLLVVFVISPDSVGSPVCRDEVDLTKRLGKRIVPVLWRKAPREQIPEGLAERDWVLFDGVDPTGTWEDPGIAGRSAFAAAMREVEAAIRLDDVLWAEHHAQWLKRAVDWDRAGRPEGSLMRAAEITAAQTWANRRPQNAAAIPELVTDFLRGSLAKEERDREELNARERRISQQTQRVVSVEADRAREKYRYDAAMRMALAGEPTVEEVIRGLTPEPFRRSQLAAAANAVFGVCLSGHSAVVRSAAFSRDGSRVVTASRDKTARVWDVATGRELARLAHDGSVTSATFDADGARVVTSSYDQTARVWDAVSGVELVRLQHDIDVRGTTLRGAAFSPDGRWVLTTSEIKHTLRPARLWDAVSGVELVRFEHDDGGASCAAFSPDGTRILTASRDNAARIWDAHSWAELAHFTHDNWISSAAFSLDGKWALTASGDKTASLWDAVTGAELLRFEHGDWVSSAAFSPAGLRILTISGKSARVWDAVTGAELVRFSHDGSVSDAAFSPEGARVVTSSGKSTRVWDAASGAELVRFSHEGSVCSTAFSPDGTQVVTASRDKTARIWDALSGPELLSRLSHDTSVYRAALSPQGTRVLTTSVQRRKIARVGNLLRFRAARLWDAATGAELLRFGHDGGVGSAAFSPDGTRVVTASQDRSVGVYGVVGGPESARVWDAASGAELVRLDHDSSVWSASFSPDGTRVVTTSGKSARVWDAVTGAELVHLSHIGSVLGGVFNHDGTRVVTASDKGARVWDAASGAELVRLGDDSSVWEASFSVDGTRVVTRSDKSARVWDAANGVELARLIHGDRVFNATFSPDGARVVTTSDDKTARVWDAVNGVKLAHLIHGDRVLRATFSADGERVVTTSNDKTARVWDAASGIELAVLKHEGGVESAVFSLDGARLVTASKDKTVRVWDVSWVCKLTGEHLLRAVARERLKGAGRLTEEELRILRPILGDVDPDVTSRWLAPSADDAEIEAILAQWRRHREIALALAKRDWAKRTEEIRAELAHRRAADAGQVQSVSRYRSASRWLALAILAVVAALILSAARSAGLWPSIPACC